MNSRIAIFFGVSLALALSAGYLTYSWLAARAEALKAAQQQKAPSTVQIVVAAKDVPRGVRLTKDMLKVAPYMPESLPPDHFVEADKLMGRIVIDSMGANEPVLESRLLSETVGMGGISPLIKPGNRAMGVKGDQVLGLGGFIRPGNKVDVLVTLDGQASPSGESVTKLVLESIPVLASGTQLEYRGDAEEPSPVDVYSLEVDPRQSEILALAATQGQLHFALRNDSDEEDIKTRGMQVDGLLREQGGAGLARKKEGGAAPQQAAQPQPVYIVPAKTVEVISGGKRETLNFDAAGRLMEKREPGMAMPAAPSLAGLAPMAQAVGSMGQQAAGVGQALGFGGAK